MAKISESVWRDLQSKTNADEQRSMNLIKREPQRQREKCETLLTPEIGWINSVLDILK